MMCVFISVRWDRLRRRPNKKRIKWNENHCTACPLSRDFQPFRKAISKRFCDVISQNIFIFVIKATKKRCGKFCTHSQIDRIYSVKKKPKIMLKTWIGTDVLQFNHILENIFHFRIANGTRQFWWKFNEKLMQSTHTFEYIFPCFANDLRFYGFICSCCFAFRFEPAYKRFNSIRFFPHSFYLSSKCENRPYH